MDTGTLGNNRIVQGHYLLEKFIASDFDVSAAAWVKTPDDEEWHLYVVSKTVDEKGLAPAYGAAKAVRRQIPDAWASRIDLRLIYPGIPVGEHLRDLQKHYEGHLPVHLPIMQLGNEVASEVYVYPPVVPAPPGQPPLTPQEVAQKVAGLMGDDRPARVTLRDDTTFLGVPIGLERSGTEMYVKFTVEGPRPLQIYPVDAIRRIE